MILFLSSNPEARANTLFDLAATAEPRMFSRVPRLTFDESSNLWMVSEWGTVSPMVCPRIYATKIKTNGRVDLERVLAYDPDNSSVGSSYRYWPVCDRWGNLYFGLFTITPIEGTSAKSRSTLHLIRISPEGIVKDYHPWPRMVAEGYSISTLSGDTLIFLGEDAQAEWTPNGRPLRISKVIVDSSGITPVYEKTYDLSKYPRKLIELEGYYEKKILDWNRDTGLYAYIRVESSVTGPPAQPDKLHLYKFDMRASDNAITQDSLGVFNWRDYVWRTYEDTWIGWMTFAHHKDGGYLLCIPDPKDRSITHVLRLDSKGEPIDPATLEGGGTKFSLDFDRRPSSAEPLVDFHIWNKPAYKEIIRDSAHVLFWGCDNEGNLYAYRKVKKF